MDFQRDNGLPIYLIIMILMAVFLAWVLTDIKMVRQSGFVSSGQMAGQAAQKTKAVSSPEKDRLYDIIYRKATIRRAEVPTYNSMQILKKIDGDPCSMILKWENIKCKNSWSFNLKYFDSSLLHTRMSNIYPRITLNAINKKKVVRHTKKCLKGYGDSVDEKLVKVVFDLKKPGGMDVYNTAAAFVHLIKQCGGR